ncbi:MAG: acetyl-CoA carboxylase biotin carboxyl carrier protein [Candidatus Limivivens sp.]|nr:acetyl-CoA carboxylase biotin carboxyl carrier protein [Candidatus Limivivens sp.]
MEIEQVLMLIDRVSSSKLTSFYFEEGNLKVSMKKKPETLIKGGTEAGKTGIVSQEPAQEAQTVEGKTIESPLVGTFYSSPSPDAEPFVKVGDQVKKGQVLGIIEAMKLMNEVESDYEGTVEAILVENEQMVEYGQPLFVIR